MITPPTTPVIKSLPIIDISSFLEPHITSPQTRWATATSIDTACKNFGFFYLTGHGIANSRLEQIIDLSHRFFALPLSEKIKIKRIGARGYQALRENITLGRRDVQEAIDVYREWDQAAKEDGKALQSPNLWPKEPGEYKDVYLLYIDQCLRIGHALVRAMGVALGLGTSKCDSEKGAEDENFFVRNTNDSFWAMRMIGYPKLATPCSTEFSCGEHTDYGCITLLLADPTPGALQVQLKDGTWLNADPIPGAFVVNIGDMMERWTNGLWKSTRHRVVHRGDGYRVSIPFFYEPNFETKVAPLRECINRTGSAKYGEVTYRSYLLDKVYNNFHGRVMSEELEHETSIVDSPS